MIKKLLILLFLTLSITMYASSGWRQVSDATYSSLSDVFFINETIGWIAGSTGTILKTTDGGYTWQEPSKPLPVVASMYSIFFVNENVGYAGGFNDLLLKSTDGGSTWNQVALDSVGGSIASIYFADENTGWILNKTNVLYTTDGGSTWSIQLTETSVELVEMKFNSPGHGVCVGGAKGVFAFYYTTDGITWTKAPNPTGIPQGYTRTDIRAVGMASDSVACITGWGSYVGMQPSFTIRTSDKGANWKYETQAEENRLYINMYGITFSDELTGIAVGGSTYKGGVAYKTLDGGITWQEIFLPTGFTGNAISIVNDKICIVGSGGGIVFSEDAGTTWNLPESIVNSTLYDMKQLPNGNKIAAGFYGGCLVSSDKGETWSSNYIAGNNVCPTVENLFFLDDNIGFAAQKNRTVSKTIDGGNTWTQIMKDTSSTSTNNYGVQFFNENLGYVVGKVASDVSAFYKTSDGGKNWTSQIGTLSNEINALYFFDANNGVVAGDESVLAHTSNGGDTWTQVTPNDVPSGTFEYNEVEFLNSTFGLACGEILIKSNDAGKTWDYVEIEGFTKDIDACAIADELTWYISGDKFVLKTTDGGVTWTDLFDEDVITAYTIYDVLIDTKGYPWVAAGGSEIYTAAPVPDVSVKLINGNSPNKFSLEANYPNPFNPSTIINYTLPSSSVSNVTLKVYDMLGQEVATLVNEVQKSGTYEVEFNASLLSSGIYIYTLQNARLLRSRKMLLIK